MAGEEEKRDEFVYRISTEQEWEKIQEEGQTYGGDLDKASHFIHLCTLNQVMGILKNFLPGRDDLYLLQIDTKKLGEGLVYEAVDDSNYYPHFYGPLKLDTVTKVEKLEPVRGGVLL